jgi:hypothetical protein
MARLANAFIALPESGVWGGSRESGARVGSWESGVRVESRESEVGGESRELGAGVGRVGSCELEVESLGVFCFLTRTTLSLITKKKQKTPKLPTSNSQLPTPASNSRLSTLAPDSRLPTPNANSRLPTPDSRLPPPTPHSIKYSWVPDSFTLLPNFELHSSAMS